MSAPSADTLDDMPAGHVCGCYACNPTLPPDDLPRIDEHHWRAGMLADPDVAIYINGVQTLVCLQAYEGANGEGWAVVLSSPRQMSERVFLPHPCRHCSERRACLTFISGDVRIERHPR